MFDKEQHEIAILKMELATAKVLYYKAMNGMRPSRQLPITVYREGSRWVCIFETDPDIMKCVVAYGESPEQACMNFDCLWNGTAEFLIDPEDEEEEEQF